MPEPYWADETVTLYLGKCEEVLPSLPAESVDAIVTDPPAAIAFMGRSWDSDRGGRDKWVAWLADCMEKAARVLKPGGHLLVWSLPRTSGWTQWALEDAGLEVRDCIVHIFGCLSEDTEILVNGQWEPYRNVKSGSLVLAYNLEHDEFAWEPVQEVYVYPDYCDTAFRIRGDHTDQIVSREHRCLVERGGAYVFERAEEAARQREARVPVLEDLPSLLAALLVPDEGTGRAQPDVLEGLRRPAVSGGEEGPAESSAEPVAGVPGVRQALPSAAIQAAWGTGAGMLAAVPRDPRCRPVAEAGGERAERLDGCLDGVVLGQDDGRGESRLEGGHDLLSQEGELRSGQVRPVSVGVRGDGPQGRLCDGAPPLGGAGNRALPAAGGSGPPRQPRPAGQPDREPDAVRDQPQSQAVRASRFTRSDLARVEPVEYSGLVWCVRVPSGAFVARRGGKVFVTGNSGFPKSLDVGKAIDRVAGVERDVVGTGKRSQNRSDGWDRPWMREQMQAIGGAGKAEFDLTAPATEDAKRWDGFGTALKPGQEMWWLARKPLRGTVAANVLEYGTGALNIDGCRIHTAGSEGQPYTVKRLKPGATLEKTGGNWRPQDGDELPWEPGREYQGETKDGRWPTNIVFTHSASCESAGLRRVKGITGGTGNHDGSVYGQRSNEGQAVKDYADADGLETVEVWACAPGCPVAELDRQSGVRRSAYPGRPDLAAAYTGANCPDGDQAVYSPGLGRASASYADAGGASRFCPTFRYQAKAPASERPRLDDGTAQTMLRLRPDLTSEQLAYVIAELKKAGVDVA